jgi:ribonuclease P protein component
MIPFSFRFHGHNSLRYVYKNGRAVRTHFATLKSSTNSHRNKSRIAVVVGKKVLKSAVGRNRIRRRIYEYIRQQIPRLSQNFDIVVIVSSSEFATMTSAELQTNIEALFDQSGLYKTP